LATVEQFVDRKRGALVGLAVGDALGAAVEFMAAGIFPRVTGYRSGGPHGLKAGEWPDDTSMALALADSMATAGWEFTDLANRYLAWWQRGEYSVNGRCFDIGNATRSALSRFKKTKDAKTSGDPSEHAAGNGSIMRLSPVPIRYADLFPDRLEELVHLLVESSLPTHASPQCQSACAYFGLVLAALIHGEDRDDVLGPDWPPLGALRKMFPLHREIDAVAAGSFRRMQPPDIVGSGYVVKSLEAALWAFHDAKDFREAVLRAVNLGDDADTSGAVCGQLAGAFWGELGIPAKWRKNLVRADMIEKGLAGLLSSAGAPLPKAAARTGSKAATSGINPELLPSTPDFSTSRPAHQKENAAAVRQALEIAQTGDVGVLKAMALPSSPKLEKWHEELVREVELQLSTPPGQTPPTRSSYWVEPGRLLAGAYPGAQDPEVHCRKIQALLDAGVRVFVNLMQEGETNHDGEPFVPYEDVVRQRCPDATCVRFSIRDLSVPSVPGLATILDAIDQSIDAGKTVYVHCWGGVGRTGTVVACWLLKHKRSTHENVIDNLKTLRRQDRERGYRPCPESAEQRQFVQTWAPPPVSEEPKQAAWHWSHDPYWTDALESFYRLRDEGKTRLSLDLPAIEEAAFDGDGPAYKLMDAMESVRTQEGMEGCRGAGRVLLALLVRLHELSRGR